MEAVGVIIVAIFSLGGLAVSLITRYNHIEHIEKAIERIEKEIKELFIRCEENEKCIAYIKGKTNGEIK